MSCQLRLIEDLSQNFHDHIVSPFEADIFVAAAANEFDDQKEVVQQVYGANLKGSVFVQDPTPEGLWGKIRQAHPHNPQLPHDVPIATVAQLFEPYYMSLCKKMIEKHEQEMGRKYVAWVRVRSDMEFLTNPPPALLTMAPEVRNKVWVPEGQNYGGINDRFAFVPRNLIERYFGLWDDMVKDGLPETQNPKYGQNPEALFMSHLASKNIKVGRFANIGAVQCCAEQKDCWTTYPLASNPVSQIQWVVGARNDTISKCGTTSHYKYTKELESARANAVMLENGGLWVQAANGDIEIHHSSRSRSQSRSRPSRKSSP